MHLLTVVNGVGVYITECQEVARLKATIDFDTLLIKELREDRDELSEKVLTLTERVRVLEEMIRRGAETGELIRLTNTALGGGKES